MRAGGAVLAAVLLGSAARAGVGEVGASILVQPPGARPAAFAEAYAAEAHGADALAYNPAGLGAMVSPEILLQYHGGFAGDTLVGASMGLPVAGLIGLAAGVVSYNSGNVQLLNATGQESAVSGQRDLLLQGGAALALRRAGLAVGFGLRLYQTELLEEIAGKATAADLGVLWTTPVEGLVFGASALNVGGTFELADAEEKLPLTVRAGAAYRMEVEMDWLGVEGGYEPAYRPAPPPNRLTVALDAIHRAGDRITSLAAGAELVHLNLAAVRGGFRVPVYNSSTRNGVLAAGAGLIIPFVRIDYAAELGYFVTLHRVSLTLVM